MADEINSLKQQLEAAEKAAKTLENGLRGAKAAAELFASGNQNIVKSLQKVQDAAEMLQGVKAIFSGPIGPTQLLAFAIGGLSAAFEYFNGAADRANEVLQDSIDQRNNLAEAIQRNHRLQTESTDLEIELMIAQGASAEAILKKKNAQEEENIAVAEKLRLLELANLQEAEQQLKNLQDKGFVGMWGRTIIEIGTASKEEIKAQKDKIAQIKALIDQHVHDKADANTRIQINNAQVTRTEKVNNDKSTEDYKLFLQKKRELSYQNLQHEIDETVNGSHKRYLQAQLAYKKELDDLKLNYSEKEKATKEYHERVRQVEEKFREEKQFYEDNRKKMDLQATVRQVDLIKQPVEEKLKLLPINKAANEAETRDNELTVEDAAKIREAKLAIAKSTIEGLGTIADLMIKDGKKNQDAHKILALGQIAIDEAQAIAALVGYSNTAAGVTGPAAPFVAAAYYASGIIRIITGIAKAKQLLGKGSSAPDSSGAPSAPSASVPSPPDLTSGAQRTLIEDAERRRKEGGQDKPNIVEAYVIESNITETQKNIVVTQERAKRRVR
jgi:hypothetical protein